MQKAIDADVKQEYEEAYKQSVHRHISPDAIDEPSRLMPRYPALSLSQISEQS